MYFRLRSMSRTTVSFGMVGRWGGGKGRMLGEFRGEAKAEESAGAV